MAINNDGYSKVSYSAPSVKQQAACMQNALSTAGCDVESIGYIETHGTGTSLGDAIEIDALKQAYQSAADPKNHCPIGSVKSNIGHVDMAAGVAGVIKTALAIYHNTIPPTIHHDAGDALAGLSDSSFYVPTKTEKWELKAKTSHRTAAVNSLGIGGTNAHLIMEEIIVDRTCSNKKSRYIIPISGRTEAFLVEMKRRLIDFLHQNAKESLTVANLSYTLAMHRTHHAHREAYLCENLKDLMSQLSQEKPVVLSSDIAKSWIKGEEINWEEYFQDEEVYKIPLPLTPLVKSKAWIEPNLKDSTRTEKSFTSDCRIAMPVWEIAQSRKSAEMVNKQIWFLFAGNDSLSQKMINTLKSFNQRVIVFYHAEHFKRQDNDTYLLDCLNESDCEKCAKALNETNVNPDHILYHYSYDDPSSNDLIKIKNIFKHILTWQSDKIVSTCLVTKNSQKLKSTDTIIANNAILQGMSLVLSQEYPISSAFIDINPKQIDEDFVVKDIIDRCVTKQLDPIIAYRTDICFVRDFQRWTPTINADYHIKEKPTLVITGGLGKIGLTIARDFALKHKAHILLLTRPTTKDQSERLYDYKDPAHQFSETVSKTLESISTNAASLYITYANVTKYDALLTVTKQFMTATQTTSIDHLFHLAANLKEKAKYPISEISSDNITQQYQPKMLGLENLTRLSNEVAINVGIIFSSISTLIGGTKMAAYAGVSAAMDAYYSAIDLDDKTNWICLDWDAWSFDDKGSTHAIDPEQGLHDISQAIKANQHRLHLTISSSDVIQRIHEFNKQNKNIPLKTNNQANIKHTSSEIMSVLENAFKECLGLSQLDNDTDFFDYGGDSLSSVELADYIEKELSIPIKTVSIIQNRTINKIHAHLMQINNQDSSSVYRMNDSDGPPIFFIHPVSGMNACYNNLVSYLSETNSCYAIQDPEIDLGDSIFNTLDEMAEHYLKLIRTVQPEGDCVMAGYSFGGTVGHAIIKLLEKQGYKNSKLFIIDGWAIYSDDTKDYKRFQSAMKRNVLEILDRIPNKTTENKLIELLWGRMKLLFDYSLFTIKSDIILFKAERILAEYRSINHIFNHWNRYTTGTVNIYKLNKTHETILDEHASKIIAGIIQSSLQVKLKASVA